VWLGTLTLEFLDPGIPDATITGVGVADVNPGGGGAALVTLGIAGGISGTVTVPVADPYSAGSLFSVMIAASLGFGTLGPFQPGAPLGEPQLTRNTLPMPGTARLCVLAPGCGFGPLLPLTANSGQTGVGVGGLLTAGGVGSVRFSVQAAPWTVGTATLTLATTQGGSVSVARAGFAHGPWSFATGSTALPGGALQLVTPIAIESQSGESLPAFGVLTLRFVPEPGSLLLLAPGLLGLFALARMRRH
jgi:hypothetical protein